MHGVETYERNSNEKTHLYRQVLATDCEISKGNLLQESFAHFQLFCKQ